MNNKGLTISMIFEASSANYGEGMGNISTLKKVSRSGGAGYTYISRQALRYNMVEQLGWNNTPVEAQGSGDKSVVQFSADSTIKDWPEIDLFGYMKTSGQKNGATTRSAVARVSNAVSMEPYSADMDFLTNMGLAKRGGKDNQIAQSEIHMSFYAYTVTIDLERVGVDGEITISSEEKARRVCALLDTIQFLYRDIKGRSENLSPVFVIGNVYDRKTPFFDNRLKLKSQNLELEPIQQSVESAGDTLIGYVGGTFKNDEEIKAKLSPVSVKSVFNALKEKVTVYYHESN